MVSIRQRITTNVQRILDGGLFGVMIDLPGNRFTSGLPDSGVSSVGIGEGSEDVVLGPEVLLHKGHQLVMFLQLLLKDALQQEASI